MRKRLLGSIAALVAGAGTAWAQPPVEPLAAPKPPAPPALAPLGPTAPQPPIGGPPIHGGLPSRAIPGNAGIAPPAVIMPPGNFGPPGDPLGIGPVNGFNSTPAPMYPMPGAPGMPAWQPAPPMPGADGRGGAGDLGYGNAPRWWFDGEYLLWFTNGQPARVPLLTTSAPADGGVIGAASTTVLAGGTGRDLGYNAINGFRLTGGFFGDADRRFGFEMSAFVLERVSNIQTFGAGGSPAFAGIPTLGRPFIDNVTGSASAIVLSGPDFGPSTAVVGTTNQTWGLEPLAVWNLYRSEPGCRRACSIDFLAGYKFVEIKEELFVNSRTDLDAFTALPQFISGPFGVITQLPSARGPVQGTFGGVNVGGPAQITVRDQFRTLNKFNGGVIGLRTEGRYGIVTLSATGKLGFGNMHERVEIFGGSSFVDPTGRSGTTPGVLSAFNLGVGGGTGSAFGGVLANSGNIGTFIRDRFTVIPEISGNIGIAVTRGFTAYVGVTAMFFPDIARPGDLVSPFVSSASIPFSPNYGALGAFAPGNTGLQIRETEHWLGGVNFGFKLRY